MTPRPWPAQPSDPQPALDTQTARRRTVVALFLCALLSSPGQTFVFALYIEPVMEALDLTRGQMSFWYAVATLSGAAALVLIGTAADRLRSRPLLLAVVGLVAIGMMLMSGASTTWQLVAALLVLRLAGQGAVGVSLLTVVVRRFHDGGRGQPLSRGTLGYSAGEALFPFIVAALIAAGGWRLSLLALAAAYVLVALPALAWLLRWPRRRPPTLLHGVDTSAKTVSSVAIVREPRFWWALLAFAVLPIAITALFFHQFAVFRTAGLAGTYVPMAFATYAAANAAATAALGRRIDRISPRAAAVVSIACFFGAIGLLLPALPPLVMVSGYAVLLGAGSALAHLAGALVWPRLFGDTGIGRVRAVAGGIRNCMTAGGPLLLSFDTGQTVIGAVGPLVLVGAVGTVAALCLPGRHQMHEAPGRGDTRPHARS